ncbi:MAG: hypothetical protein ABI634_01635 [Acidobacteriota bacterium]
MSRVVFVVTVGMAAMAQSKAPDPVVQARQLYNDQKYDEAIRRATEALATPALKSPAALVIARAHLERFRQSSDATDLPAARTALKTVIVDGLSARDRVDLMVALGEAMYFDDEYGTDDRFSAAAEQFEVALDHADVLDAKSRDLLFDWWASALDRQAQQDGETGRAALYARVQKGAERELVRDDTAASASYWLAAASRGVNDLTRAIGAASAAWVRAGTLGARGVTLREDLDRLMRQVILPERARELSVGTSPKPTFAILEEQWQRLTEQWR